MATTEERMRILRMIQEDKISAEEGAKLLAALRESRKEPRPVGAAVFATSRGARGMLRVRVTDMTTGQCELATGSRRRRHEHCQPICPRR